MPGPLRGSHPKPATRRLSPRRLSARVSSFVSRIFCANQNIRGDDAPPITTSSRSTATDWSRSWPRPSSSCAATARATSPGRRSRSTAASRPPASACRPCASRAETDRLGRSGPPRRPSNRSKKPKLVFNFIQTAPGTLSKPIQVKVRIPLIQRASHMRMQETTAFSFDTQDCCPVCGNRIALAEVLPHPERSGLEIQGFNCRKCGPVKSLVVRSQRQNSRLC